MKKIRCYLKHWNDVVYLSDDSDYLRERKKEGKAVILLLTKENRTADFSSFPFALELEDSMKLEFDESTDVGECISCVPEDLEDIMDTAYLERVMLRHKHLPLTITENERLRIREITREDGFEIPALFDKEGAGRFLDGFDRRPEEIEAELSDYIKTAYDISDYGIWAVCLKREADKERRTSEENGRERESEKRIHSEQEITLEKEKLPEKKSRFERNGAGEYGNDLKTNQEQAEELIGIVSLQLRDLTDANMKVGSNKQELLFVKSKYLTLQNDYCFAQSVQESELLELGFALYPGFQRHGYGYEMCQLILKHFEQDNIQFIARTNEKNNASIALLKKLGFKDVPFTWF